MDKFYCDVCNYLLTNESKNSIINKLIQGESKKVEGGIKRVERGNRKVEGGSKKIDNNVNL